VNHCLVTDAWTDSQISFEREMHPKKFMDDLAEEVYEQY
jgi:hypothetical protein